MCSKSMGFTRLGAVRVKANLVIHSQSLEQETEVIIQKNVHPVLEY